MRGREVVAYLRAVEYWLKVGTQFGLTPGPKETAFAFHQRVGLMLRRGITKYPISFRWGRSL